MREKILKLPSSTCTIVLRSALRKDKNSKGKKNVPNTAKRETMGQVFMRLKKSKGLDKNDAFVK